MNNIFEAIKKNKRSFLGAKKGTEFESRIEEFYKDKGYMVMDGDRLKVFMGDKFPILKHNIQEDLDKTNHYFKDKTIVKQPFGSQQYPDFLVVNGNKIIPIEAKFSSKKQSKPIWNGGVPRGNGIYVFGSYNYGDKGDLTFFMGRSVINPELRKKLVDLFNDYCNEMNQKAKELCYEHGLNKGGFIPVIRRSYDQQKLDKKSMNNYFSNPIRKEMEQEVIDFYNSPK